MGVGNWALPSGVAIRQDDVPFGNAQVERLCRGLGVRRLDLFGSAATGHFDPPRSDLDFLVEFDALEPSRYAENYFSLREGLVALFGRDVDLGTEASLANPFFRRRVLAERRTLFRAAPELLLAEAE